MLEQQNLVIKMNQTASMSDAENQGIAYKRPMTDIFRSGHSNQKRKKRFKQAFELGLELW